MTLVTPDQMDSLQSNLQLVKELVALFKNDPSSNNPVAQNLHGVNPTGGLGLFGAPGVDPRMFSTLVGANFSFTESLTMSPNIFINHIREIFTGVNADIGTNPNNTCDTPVQPGNGKVCQQIYTFGRAYFGFQPRELATVGQYYTPADQNRVVSPDILRAHKFYPHIPNATPKSALWYDLERSTADFSRNLENALIQSNRTNGPTGAGSIPMFMTQFDGLDRQIRTGYTDALTGIACPAADSLVRSFDGNDITATNATWGTIVQALTDIYMNISISVERMGYDMGSSAWAWVMNPDFFYALTRQWPCAYYTTGCQVLLDDTSTNARYNLDGETTRRMQDEMYSGRYLMINGMRIPVLFSDGVAQTPEAANQFATSVFLVPIALNGIRTLYVEYFPMDNAQQEEYATAYGMNDETRTLNGGFWRMIRLFNGCIEYRFTSQFRLMLEAPFAAGRLDNITWINTTQSRTPFPGRSFYADGGRSQTNVLY